MRFCWWHLHREISRLERKLETLHCQLNVMLGIILMYAPNIPIAVLRSSSQHIQIEIEFLSLPFIHREVLRQSPFRVHFRKNPPLLTVSASYESLPPMRCDAA